MPYGISNNQSDCSGWAAVKKESDGSFTTLKCYASKQDAVDRMVAQSLAEDIEPIGEVGKRNIKEVRADSYKPTSGMKEEAKKGLAWRAEFNRGGTSIGVARARDIANDSNFPLVTVKRMYSYFARHEVDKKGQGFSPDQDGFPSAGRIAWALWGGDAGQSWSSKIVKQNKSKEPRGANNSGLCKVEAVMTNQRDVYGNTNDVAPEGMVAGSLSDTMPIADQQEEPLVEEVVTLEMLVEELRSLVASTVSIYFQAHGSHWNVRGTDFAQYHSLFQEIYEDVYSAIDPTAEMVRKLDGEAPFELQELVSLRKVGETVGQDNPASLSSALLVSNDQMLECLNCSYEYADELDEQGICNFLADRIDMHRKWGWQLKASLDATQQRSHSSWAVRSDDGKRSYAYTNLEVRATDDGKTLVGYAAMWDTPSHPMPFTEFVKRGAFTKTLNDGADVRLLIDHEGVPLARTKSGTLKLSEDERGLLVEAQLDPLNPDAARVMSAMKRGDLSQMSFAFRTVKDAWSKDRKTRELREVQLFDVSIVTFPAYEQTVAELRKEVAPVTVAVTSGVRLRKSQIELQKYRSR